MHHTRMRLNWARPAWSKSLDQAFLKFSGEGDAHEIQNTQPRRLAGGSRRNPAGSRSVDPRILLLAFLVELSQGGQVLRRRCVLHLLDAYPLGPFPRAFAQKIPPIHDDPGSQGVLDTST